MVQSHYFKDDDSLQHAYKNIEYQFANHTFVFSTDRGVFSRDRVDFGSNVMLNAVAKDLVELDANPERCLDFGCGYGVVSIVLNTLYQEQKWTALDINSRAVELAKYNSIKHNLKIDVIENDGIPQGFQDFDLILLNPPIRIGKTKYYRMFEQAARALSSRGLFYIVIQKKQGALSAFKFLTSIFRDVETIDRSGGYHTIRCRN